MQAVSCGISRGKEGSMRTIVGTLLGLLVAAAGGASAQGSLGSDANHVVLVQDCEAAGWDEGLYLNTKCFESIADLKIWGTDDGGVEPAPSAASPLTVDIGPGEFATTLTCPGSGGGVGYTTFRGAGRDRTTLKHTSNAWPYPITVIVDSCESLAFEDLRIEVEDTGGTPLGIAVYWTGDGSSTWTDVDIVGAFAGWYDASCGGAATDAPSGSHYFWGSTIWGGGLAFYGACGDTWFYGGEIAALTLLRGVYEGGTAVQIAYRAAFHAFGTAIRHSTAGVSTGTGTSYGVRVGPPGNSETAGHGEFHFHGGIVSVDTSNLSGVHAVGMQVTGAGTGRGHTLATAFAVNGGASSTRLKGGGIVQSPLLWEASTEPPAAGGEKTGLDLYVETDCDANGCSGSGTEPHLMVYSSVCDDTGTNSPWFNTVRGVCRGD
jgi:hypothetical protein